MSFDADSVASSRIREDQLYEAVRVLLTARVGTARISVQVDIGFGDAVHPHPVEMAFPTLLGQPPVQLLTYPREVVFAEKFHAMVSLGLLNSRMKDFYDLSVRAAPSHSPVLNSVPRSPLRSHGDRRRCRSICPWPCATSSPTAPSPCWRRSPRLLETLRISA